MIMMLRFGASSLTLKHRNGPRVGNLEGVEYDASDEADSSSGNVPLKDAEISRNPEVGSILGDVPLRDEEISCDREVDSHLGEESCDPKRPEALTSNEYVADLDAVIMKFISNS